MLFENHIISVVDELYMNQDYKATTNLINNINVKKEGKDSTEVGQQRSISGTLIVKTLAQAGVAGTVTPIHSFDGAKIVELLRRFEFNQIFDAMVAEATKLEEISKASNEIFMEMNKRWNFLQEVQKSYAEVINNVDKKEFESIVTNPKFMQKYGIKNSMETISSKGEVIETPLEAIERLTNQLDRMVKQNDNRRAREFQKDKYVEQNMANSNVIYEYKGTSEEAKYDIKDVEAIMNKVKNIKGNMFKELIDKYEKCKD